MTDTINNIGPEHLCPSCIYFRTTEYHDWRHANEAITECEDHKSAAEPRTCETCATGCLPNERVYVNPDAEDPCPGWTPRAPQSADVETARSKIELAIKFGLPIDARMALRDALEALDRIAGKLSG